MVKPKIGHYSRIISVSDFLIFSFLLIICLSVYFNALNNNFIFDDNFLVVKNLYIKNISFIPQLFKTDIFHFQHPENLSLGIYYRPLQSLSYAFDYSLWKLNPMGYRLTNILIHSLNSFFIFLLIRLIFKDAALALLSAVLFCIHPIHVCLVSFIAGRSNLLEAFFMFLSLWSFLKYCLHGQKPSYITLSLLSFILAILSREGAILLPLFIFICARVLKVNYKNIIKYSIPFLCIGVFYIIFRLKFIPCDKLNFSDSFSLENISRFVFLLQDYISQLILPAYFQAYLFGKNIFLKSAIAFFSLAFIAYILIKVIIRRDRIAIFALAFYFIGLSPIINLARTIGYFGKILSEHYVYIASIGFFIVISRLILISRARLKRFAAVFLFTVIAFYVSLTVINNINYRDEESLYNSVLKVDEHNKFIRVNLGNIYLNKKMYDRAIEEAKSVLTAEPDAWDAYLLWGNVLLEQGNLDKAMQLYKKVLILYPRSSEALNNIALIYYKEEGKEKEAYEAFKKALQMDPESLLILRNFMDLLIHKKLYNEAMFVAQKILELNPDDVSALVKLGIIFAESGHFKEAEVVFKDALRLNPASFDTLSSLGTLYANMGDLDKGMSFWNRALAINPSSKEIKNNLEKATKLKVSKGSQK